MLAEPIENMYTTEENGIQKIIYQTPWKEDGEFCGVTEISFQLDPKFPGFVRK